MKFFGELLLDRIKALGLSQRAVAKMLGSNHAFLSRVINGERSCPLPEVDAWIRILEVPPAERDGFKEAAVLTHANEELLAYIRMKNTKIEQLEKEIARLNNIT